MDLPGSRPWYIEVDFQERSASYAFMATDPWRSWVPSTGLVEDEVWTRVCCHGESCQRTPGYLTQRGTGR